MTHGSTERRRAAAQLLDVLEEMLAGLAKGTAARDVEWLRPLAVLSAEIEYSALRRDGADLAQECRELSDLLAGAPSGKEPFAAHYPVARRESPAVAARHARALAACEALMREAR